jgi:hypothetical protein
MDRQLLYRSPFWPEYQEHGTVCSIGKVSSAEENQERKMIFSARGSRCKVCVLVRIHLVLFLTILVTWKLKPDLFVFVKSTEVRDIATALVLSVFTVILILKVFIHYLNRRSR